MNGIPDYLTMIFEIKSKYKTDAYYSSEHYAAEKIYCVENADGQRMFMRVSDKNKHDIDRKKYEYELMERVFNLGVRTAQPIDFGLCDDGKNIYTLSSWIDGENIQDVIHLLTETEQYAVAYKLGADLRLIHSITSLKTPKDWEVQLNDEIDWTIEEYLKCGNRFADEKYILDYLEKNRYLLKNRPQCLLHYDYTFHNILLVNKSEPYIIDFAGYTFGDPWREFYISFWIRGAYPHYLTGFINGYFNDSIPELFFSTLLLYNSISLLKDCIYRRVDEEAAFFLKCHGYMNNSVPIWYLTHYTK